MIAPARLRFRTTAHRTFRTFDFANPDLHVAVRHETTVPQQALFFLNGAFAAERARALARRTHGHPDHERIHLFHRAILQRSATPEEVAGATRFLRLAESDTPPATPDPPPTAWQYGTGSYDESAQRIASFTPLPHATGLAWQGAPAWPGGETGWAQLTATGGHPGNTRAQACVRRWVAPATATVQITGTLKHEPSQGDGVRGFIVSSRHGLLAQATVHATETTLAAADIAIEAGDTLDFVVDIGGTLDSDQFLWAPVVTTTGATWHAADEFAAPAPAPDFLQPWEQYAHVLLLTNEVAFVD